AGSLSLGVWTDNVMEHYWGADPRAVVIDEYFGTWVALLAVQYVDAPAYVAVWLAIIAFALFRIIDIFKPLGCRWIDRNIHGGWGCMLDDALAGAYAAVITLIIRYAHAVERLYDLLYAS
ncbi:MAG: phosphatidylglycerophosphatase A, partial [Prevotella sp.]|nr:phosphatidylglycerophosphatase A [Prevotella sp.]